MSADNVKGLVLALSSSLFIGASFIIKKKGLKKAAASSSGVRAGNKFLLPLTRNRRSFHFNTNAMEKTTFPSHKKQSDLVFSCTECC
jgi:hypothetical protein